MLYGVRRIRYIRFDRITNPNLTVNLVWSGIYNLKWLNQPQYQFKWANLTFFLKKWPNQTSHYYFFS